ncbi:MerR family transcriptional regulator, partial [Nocardiopsis alba]
GRPAHPEGGPVRGELVRRTRVTIFNTATDPEERPERGGGLGDTGDTRGQSGPDQS